MPYHNKSGGYLLPNRTGIASCCWGFFRRGSWYQNTSSASVCEMSWAWHSPSSSSFSFFCSEIKFLLVSHVLHTGLTLARASYTSFCDSFMSNVTSLLWLVSAGIMCGWAGKAAVIRLTWEDNTTNQFELLSQFCWLKRRNCHASVLIFWRSSS